jgi:anthranilate synthase/aminodeoxychorismate synthase-like glutamine amidotransferase
MSVGRVVVLDNYDSFTWNLVDAIESAGARCDVYRSDAVTLGALESMAPRAIILSPGPFGPEQAGICGDVVRHLGDRIPILGVCLGMQVISQVAGAIVKPSGRPVHGKSSMIVHDGRGVFEDLPNPFSAARYHSLIVDPMSIPDALEVSSWSEDGHIMSCRWRHRPIEGVLFHPESFLTAQGPHLIRNFIGSAHAR